MGDKRKPLKTSRQLPAPKGGSSQVAPIGTSRQLPEPETRGSSRQNTVRTSRRLPAPEPPEILSYDPFRTARQLPAPETHNAEQYIKTSRQLAAPTSSQHKPTFRNPSPITRKKSSRVEFLEQTGTTGKDAHKEYPHDKGSKGDHPEKNRSHERNLQLDFSREKTSRRALPPTTNTAPVTSGHPPKKAPVGPSRLTDTSSANAREKSKTYKTVATTYATRATKGPGKSTDNTETYSTIKVPKTQLPSYATKGLTKQELEVQQVLSIQVPCPQGFVWLKQQEGWRCQGGSHWLTDYQAMRLARGEEPAYVGCQAGPGPPGSRTNLPFLYPPY